MANKVEPTSDVYDFKTVALGFDKQAVIKYIGSLSKKMKVVEEEREEKIRSLEEKLAKALEGGGALLDAERENELQGKIDARDASIASLNKEIELLKKSIAAKDATIKKFQDDSSALSNAQTEQLIASALNFAKQLLDDVDGFKKSVEGYKGSIEKIKNSSLEELASIAPAPVKEEPVKAEPVKAEPVKTEPVKEAPAKKEPAKVESLDETPVKAEPVKKEPVKASEVSMNDLIITENVVEKGEDLVIEDVAVVDKGEDLIAFDEAAPEEKGADLGNDLYEMLIDPSDADTADLSSLLADQEEEDKKLNESLAIKPADVDPGYSEFSDLMASDSDDQTEFERDDDVFNFAFAEEGEEDDADMSTDATPMNNLF